MLATILGVSIFMGLFFRSIYGFLFSLIALLLLIYPTPTITILIIGGTITFFINQRK